MSCRRLGDIPTSNWRASVIQMNNFVLWQVTSVIRYEGGVVHDSGWNQDQDKCRLLNLCHFEAGLFDLFPDHGPHWYVCTLNLEACSLHWVLESLERSLERMAAAAVERCALKLAFHTPCVFGPSKVYSVSISHSDCLSKLSSYDVILWLRLKQWKILSGGKRQLIHCYSWMHLEAAHFGSAILVVCDLGENSSVIYWIFNGNLMFRGNRFL